MKKVNDKNSDKKTRGGYNLYIYLTWQLLNIVVINDKSFVVVIKNMSSFSDSYSL